MDQRPVVDVEGAEQQVRAIQDRARAQIPTGPPAALDAPSNVPSGVPGGADGELQELAELERRTSQEAPDEAASPARLSDPLERLQKLDLRDRGALSDGEFAAEKAKILDR